MKRIALIIVLFGITSVLFAQKANKAKSLIQRANKEYLDERYSYAIAFYNAAARYSKPDSIVLHRLAESYYQIKEYDSAYHVYDQLYRQYNNDEKIMYRRAELLANLKKYDEAIIAFGELSKRFPSNSVYQNKYLGLQNRTQFFIDSLDYTLGFLKINSPQSDFSPQLIGRNLVFVSNRYYKKVIHKQFGWDALPFAHIYKVPDTSSIIVLDAIPASVEKKLFNTLKINDDNTAATSNDNNSIAAISLTGMYSGDRNDLPQFSEQLDAKYNYGPLCFNKTGDKVYFTRNSSKKVNGRYNLEICEAQYINSEWTQIKVVSFVEPAYDFFHPALTEDGSRLYFSSNRPGGMGGVDIYYVNIVDGKIEPTIIHGGKNVNSAGDELFSTISGKTFFFSSNGMAGLGGLDIYKSVWQKNDWSQPANVGYPLNSNADDFGLIFSNNETKGYVTSNRRGNDDIYTFQKVEKSIPVDGVVLNRADMRRLPGVTVYIKSKRDTGRIALPITTTYTGAYRFDLKPNREYELQYYYKDTLEETMVIATPAKTEPYELKPVIIGKMTEPAIVAVVENDRDKDGIPDLSDKCPDVKGIKPLKGCPAADILRRLAELARNVYFNTAKADLKSESFKPLAEVIAIMQEYPDVLLTVEGHTDNQGSAEMNKGLSQRRAATVVRYLTSKGIAADRLSSAGYGLERPIATNTTPAGRALNRRVEMKAIFKNLQ